MAKPSVSKYIETLGKQVKNQQQLLGYYGELYEFYNDKLPDNKHIYYLEEDPYRNPASRIPSETIDFFSAKPFDLSLLTTSIQFYKVFTKTGKRVEIPFDNRMDFESFKDPVKYLDRQTSFISERFMGPVVGLEGLKIIYNGLGGKGATPATLSVVMVEVTMKFQDVKMLFKNLSVTDKVSYKDIFAQPTRGAYRINIIVGYEAPDGIPGMERFTHKKLSLNLVPNAPRTQITYNEDGSATLTTTLFGNAEDQTGNVNLLSGKYYKNIKKENNMLVVQDEKKYSEDEFEKKVSELDKLKSLIEIDKKEKTKPDNKSKSAKPDEKPVKGESGNKLARVKKLEFEVKKAQRNVQLATAVGSSPPSFPFVSVLYALGKVYYIELDNKMYKDYITKIADGEPVDVSNLELMPKKEAKIQPSAKDIIGEISAGAPGDKVDFSASSLNIRSFNKEDKSSSKFEKVKFFYFGDLLDIILNNQKGGGIGQDLDALSTSAYKILLGPAIFVKNKETKKIYNIANVPISLDMFLFELNKLVVNNKAKKMNFRYFISSFMKTFFDLVVLSGEKQKTGKDQQYYDGKLVFTLDADTLKSSSKFIKDLKKHNPTKETTKLQDFLVVRTSLINKKISKKAQKAQNMPTIFLGGPDKGPLKTISFETQAVAGLTEATIARSYNLNKGTPNTIGEVEDDSILITSKVNASITVKGNPYLNLSDHVFIDSRFVDGGFFQEKNNLIFFTGYFYIHALVHTILGNTWETVYTATFFNQVDTPTFNVHKGILPDSQNASLMKEVGGSKTTPGDGANAPSESTIQSSAASVSDADPLAARPAGVEKETIK